MNWRTTAIIAISVAVTAIVMMLLRGYDKPAEKPQDDELWRVKVQQREQVISEKDSIIATITKDREIQVRKHDSVTSRLKQRELALIRKLKEANADIQVIADSLPKVKRYVELADSTIAVKDSLYTREVNHNLAQEQLYKLEIAAMAERHLNQQKISEVLETKVIALEKQNTDLVKKIERKKLGARILTGITMGLAAALTITALSQ